MVWRLAVLHCVAFISTDKIMKENTWVKFNFKENVLVCDRCTGFKKMPDVPMEIKKYLSIMTKFSSIHKKCTI